MKHTTKLGQLGAGGCVVFSRGRAVLFTIPCVLAINSSALAGGCPPPPTLIDPPYTFRKVAQAGDVIQGHIINRFEDFEILENGRVTFQADLTFEDAPGVFTEQTNGTFQAIARGSVIGGHVVDNVSLPRFDSQGTRYMGLSIAGVGKAIFINSTMFVSESSAGLPTPVVVNALSDWKYVDPDELGNFMILVRESWSEDRLVKVNTQTASTSILAGEADIIEGFHVQRIEADPVDGLGNDGIPLFQALGNNFAILTPSFVITQGGETFAGYPIQSLSRPRRNNLGDYFFYEANGTVFHRSPSGVEIRERGPGDAIAGNVLSFVEEYAINESNDVAVAAKTMGLNGIFQNETRIAIEHVTTINGVAIDEIFSVPPGVSMNNAGQVLFRARLVGEPEALFVATLDEDGDGDVGELDNCPLHYNPIQGDFDSDGTGNACDCCPADPNKIAPGFCGCGLPEEIGDEDGDGVTDCFDNCPVLPNPDQLDSDGDETGDVCDGCPLDSIKTEPGVCGCNTNEDVGDVDGDGCVNCIDECPFNPNKCEAGQCGCGVADTDTDGDGTPDCIDGCPSDPNKIAPGQCGCGQVDGGPCPCGDCCPNDPTKSAPGICGCGVPDTDTDMDGAADCIEDCDTDPNKFAPGLCGCGVSDADTDADTVPDCNDVCPGDDDTIDSDSNGQPDCAAGGSPIPTTSTWGLIALALLLMCGGSVWRHVGRPS